MKSLVVVVAVEGVVAFTRRPHQALSCERLRQHARRSATNLSTTCKEGQPSPKHSCGGPYQYPLTAACHAESCASVVHRDCNWHGRKEEPQMHHPCLTVMLAFAKAPLAARTASAEVVTLPRYGPQSRRRNSGTINGEQPLWAFGNDRVVCLITTSFAEAMS